MKTAPKKRPTGPLRPRRKGLIPRATFSRADSSFSPLTRSRLEIVEYPYGNVRGLGAAPAETWLIIGTDSRADAPAGPDRYGAATEAGDGGRADVIALLQPRPDGLTVLVIPVTGLMKAFLDHYGYR